VKSGEGSRWLVALTLLAVVPATGCQPEGETPGLWLRGDLVEEKVADWSFSDEIQET
jgi:hypothetical protein